MNSFRVRVRVRPTTGQATNRVRVRVRVRPTTDQATNRVRVRVRVRVRPTTDQATSRMWIGHHGLRRRVSRCLHPSNPNHDSLSHHMLKKAA